MLVKHLGGGIRQYGFKSHLVTVMILHEIFNLSFFLCKMGAANGAYLIRLYSRMYMIIHMKHLPQCLYYNGHSINLAFIIIVIITNIIIRDANGLLNLLEKH